MDGLSSTVGLRVRRLFLPRSFLDGRSESCVAVGVIGVVSVVLCQLRCRYH